MPPSDFAQHDIQAKDYLIRTYQKNTSDQSPVHIYIEGDGYAFTASGQPSHNPTPRNTFIRDLAASDTAQNVIYIARPCQYNMSHKCTQSDWTDGRFSQKIIDNMTYTIKQISNDRPITLIGYSGGALISGLIIQQNSDLKIQHWITIAGVLNHADWTAHFDDKPLLKSQDLKELPNVPQTHYIAENDKTVPAILSNKWTEGKKQITVKDATHNKFPNFKLNFN
jgi:hypothetical protein